MGYETWCVPISQVLVGVSVGDVEHEDGAYGTDAEGGGGVMGGKGGKVYVNAGGGGTSSLV